MLVVYLERDAAEWLLQRMQQANQHAAPHKTAQVVEMALIAAISSASMPHNGMKDFGQGMSAATDAEAAASIK